MRAVRPLEVAQFGGSVCGERSRNHETRRVMDSDGDDGDQEHAANQGELDEVRAMSPWMSRRLRHVPDASVYAWIQISKSLVFLPA